MGRMLPYRRLALTAVAILVAAGCVAPEESGDENPPTVTPGLDDTNQTGVPDGDAGIVGQPGPGAEYEDPSDPNA